MSDVEEPPDDPPPEHSPPESEGDVAAKAAAEAALQATLAEEKLVEERKKAIENERAQKEGKRKKAISQRPQKGLGDMKFDFANLVACKVEAKSSPTLATTLKGMLHRVASVEISTQKIEETGVSKLPC